MENLLEKEALRQLVALPEKVNELDRCFRQEITGIKVTLAEMKASVRIMFAVAAGVGTIIGSITGGIIVAVIAKGL